MIFFVGAVFYNPVHGQTASDIEQDQTMYVSASDSIHLGFKTSEGVDETVDIPKDKLLFNITPHYEQDQTTIKAMDIALDPSMNDTYDTIRAKNQDSTVVIYPAFTQAAYESGGFYDYYDKKCDSSCLTISIPDKLHGLFSANEITTSVLALLNYKFITDIDVDKNPSILQNYDKVILLHNEYVTKTEFDAITKHSNVVFLFPNALYAQITTDYDKNTFTLVKGHGYPDPGTKNGFNWPYDNSKFEYDVKCDDWNYYHKENYTMMNCFPEFKVLYGLEFLRELKSNDPASILDNISNWLRYPDDVNANEQLLDSFGISGNHIQHWVKKPAVMVMNNEISRHQFEQILSYISKT